MYPIAKAIYSCGNISDKFWYDSALIYLMPHLNLDQGPHYLSYLKIHSQLLILWNFYFINGIGYTNPSLIHIWYFPNIKFWILHQPLVLLFPKWRVESSKNHIHLWQVCLHLHCPLYISLLSFSFKSHAVKLSLLQIWY